MLTIVADEKIPLVKELFEPWGRLLLYPSVELNAQTIAPADVLLIRSVTTIDEKLLKRSKIKFIGTPTAGIDHLAFDLQSTHLAWAYAPGANATAVCQYVLCVLAYLRKNNLLSRKAKIAIIGVGNIGMRVTHFFSCLGYTIHLHDPPKSKTQPLFKSATWEVLRDCDLFSFHLPLVKTGLFPTFHWLNEARSQQLKKGTIIINTSRGAILDNTALVHADHLHFCIDTWENEPTINRPLLKKALIATPHIAGYTEQAKLKAIFEIYQQFLKHFEFKDTRPYQEIFKPTIPFSGQTHHWEDIVLKIYDPNEDSQKTKNFLINSSNIKQDFTYLREHYSFRNEFSAFYFTPPFPPVYPLLQKFGFN